MRTLVVVLSLALVASCNKSEPKAQALTGSGSSVGSGSAVAAGSGSSATGAPGAATIELPKLSGTPANKSTKPIDKEIVDKLAALSFPGFEKEVRKADAKVIDVRHKTMTRPKLGVTVNVAACTDCMPMELAKWQGISAALKANLMPEELRKRPDTVFEVGETDVNGQKLIYSYQVGHFFGKDETGQPQGSYSDAYVLYFNDGINQLRLVAEYKDDAMSREDMLKVAPREDLEKLAKSFFDAFTHAW